MKPDNSIRLLPASVGPRRFSAIVVGVALLFLATGCAEEVSLPDELFGTYTTTESRYAGRSLELSSERIVFGLGDAGNSLHSIESISLEEEHGKKIYTIAFDGEGGTDHLVFHEVDGKRGAIVLRNQTAVTWTKQGDAK